MAKEFDVGKFDRNMTAESSGAAPFRWHSVDEAGFRLSGFPFRSPGGPFNRMPDAPEGTYSPGVTGLARHTSGGALAFTPLETREHYGIAVRKGRPDLLEAVNAVIRERNGKEER